MPTVNNNQLVKPPTVSFDDWKAKYPNLVADLSETLAQEVYQWWLAKLNSLRTEGSTTLPQYIDNSDEVSTTNKTDNSRSNVDLLGLTDVFTHLGIATGNSDIVKLGALANTGVSTFLRVRNLKGLKGIDKTASISGIAGGAADTLDNVFFGDLAAKNSTLTNELNTGYDMASSALMSMGGPASILGGFMKVNGLASDMLTSAGIGTDLITTADKIFDSKLLKLTPVGLVNGIFSRTSNKFSVDNDVRSLIGGSYGGAYSFMDDAASKADKEYGLFSSGARNDANELIDKAKTMLGQIGRINKNARDRWSIANNTSDLLSTNYQFNLMGGYDQRYMRAAKEGGKIERIKKINLTFRKGGQIHNVINLETKEVEWQPTLIEEVQEFKTGGSINWQYDTWEPTIIDDEWEPTIVDFFEDGGKTKESKKEPLSNQLNVIPEGALHARKHHMENTEGLTQKGIPVIDNKGEQQAEIELNEIIFNLEVTKKLEELCEDGSDEAAIEAGKLLVQEILFNTEDRTGLIKTLKLGGTINGSSE